MEELGAHWDPEGAKDQGAAPRSNQSESEQEHCQSELRLLLVGKHGAGKSATGNTILDKMVFESRFSGEREITKECQRARGIVSGTEVVVIDTPDLFSLRIGAEDKRSHLESCVKLSAPSLHALLLIIPIGHFKKEDTETIKGIKCAFGQEIRRHSIIVFTRKDDLEDSLDEYIESSDSLRAMVRDCRGRYCAFNNKASKEERNAQVSELLCKIKQLVDENRGPCYLHLKNEHSELQDIVNEPSDNSYGSEEMQLQLTSSELAPEPSELRVLLVGKHGAGKSTVGNRLLGKRAFDTGFREEPITTTFKSESRVWKTRKLLIIDTPDISSSNNFQSELRRRAFEDPHVFLMVIPIGSFSEKDTAVLETIRQSFGNKFVEHMFILLTREEDYPQATEELKASNSSLCDLIKQCENRYGFSNYKAVGEDEKSQVEKLLQELVSLTQQNENRPCENVCDTLSLVLVGSSGSGKSATGNTILGRPAFLSQLSAQSVTRVCQSGKEKLGGKKVVVVDTPPLLPIPSHAEEDEEIKCCLNYCEGNSILFVLVFQLGRFTQMEQNVLDQLKTIFGKEVKKYTIVLFTRKEDLEDESIEDYIKNIDDKALKKTVEDCGGRVCAFNNRESGQARETQVRSLLTMAEELIKCNGGHGYTYNCHEISQRMKHAQEMGRRKNNTIQEFKNKLERKVQKFSAGVKSFHLQDAQEV